MKRYGGFKLNCDVITTMKVITIYTIIKFYSVPVIGVLLLLYTDAILKLYRNIKYK